MAQENVQQVITTRFLLISDTHNNNPSCNGKHIPFRHSLPSADVLLHAGDLTMDGGDDNYRHTIAWLATSDAELKIVIAGNHDIDLDAPYYKAHYDPPQRAERDIQLARDAWTSKQARNAGIVYLEEGLQQFQLRNGALFTVFQAPLFFSFSFSLPGLWRCQMGLRIPDLGG